MTEVQYPLAHIQLAAQIHGPERATPILAFHGWLDNAASFEPLAPYLPEYHLIALDLAGHGLSGHRPPGSFYYFADYLSDIAEMLEKYLPDPCILMGHSLGGGVASLLAAALPERFSQLILIDSLGPFSFPYHDITVHLQQVVKERVKLREKERSLYTTKEQAVEARLQVSDMTRASVALLVERGLEQTSGGYQWRSDPRLRLRTPVTFSNDEIKRLMQSITLPTLFIEATNTLPLLKPIFDERREFIPNLTHQVLDGYHHLHMDKPEAVGQAIAEFLAKN